MVAEKEASAVYHWISDLGVDLGLFDERDYCLGEAALLAGSACRLLGKREDALLWLDRAEAGYRHTMNPAPGLANVAYARLALRFEIGRYGDVLELAPSLEASFRKLHMTTEAAKCRLLCAMTLKQAGRNLEAIGLLDELHVQPGAPADDSLRARILVELGDLRQLEGQLSEAMHAFQQALPLLPDTSPARADLKLYVAGVYRAMGSLDDAVQALAEAHAEYEILEMKSRAAYTRLVTAEVLLLMKRDREAEWQVLAAFPTIDEMRMVPEACEALALLRESIRRRKTDTSALQELRTLLQTAG